MTLFGEGAGTRSRSPLAGEVVLNPLDTLEIRSSGLWDPDTGDTEEGRSQLTFHSTAVSSTNLTLPTSDLVVITEVPESSTKQQEL